jgi:class 3 adenylate cyclase
VAGLVIHGVVYVAVVAMLFFFWSVGPRPDDSDGATVAWPLFVAVPWGAALAIHAATVLVNLPRRILDAVRARRRSDRDGDGPPPTTGPRRRWVVVLFTDIARSTPLAETLGDDAWVALLSEHRRVVRHVLGRHGGTEIGTQGDGFLCRFDTPDAAVDAAVDLQAALATSRHDAPDTPGVRIGVHAGEAVDDDDDLVGRAVNLAARVMGAAEPDEILVTEPVADHLRPGHRVIDRGLHDLKGIARPRHLLAVDWQPTVDVDTDDGDPRDQPRM